MSCGCPSIFIGKRRSNDLQSTETHLCLESIFFEIMAGNLFCRSSCMGGRLLCRGNIVSSPSTPTISHPAETPFEAFFSLCEPTVCPSLLLPFQLLLRRLRECPIAHGEYPQTPHVLRDRYPLRAFGSPKPEVAGGLMRLQDNK